MKNPSPLGQGVTDSQPRSWLGYPPVRERAVFRAVMSRGVSGFELVELKGFEPLTF
jgi:hypothetical protein